jgi:hypothetical protein
MKLKQQGMSLTRELLGNMDRNKIDTTPVFKQKQAQLGQQAWQLNVGNAGYGRKNIEDIRWLID